MLTIAVSLLIGFAANRRWWLVFIPIAVGVFIGSAVSTLGAITMTAAGVVGFGLGMLARRWIERRRARPRISD
jgi:hypothetical protein